MRSISSEMMQGIEAIPWFTKCEEPFDLNIGWPIRQVLNWRRAELHWDRQSWDDNQLDARNVVTIYLSDKYSEEFALWNDLVRSAKKQMQNSFYPAITEFAQRHELPRSFISNVKWDILHAVMEEAYADCDLPVIFYLDLLKVYEAGHMPCGWAHGDWPAGTLIVY